MINLVRTGILMAFLTGIFLAAGYLIGGQSGMLIAFVFALGTNLFAYWNSDKAVLSMYGAQEVDETTAPDLVHLVRVLSQNAGLPMHLPQAEVRSTPRSAPPRAFCSG
jgi:heat shock protein HtpX